MKNLILFSLVYFALISCDSFLEVGPNTNELDREIVFENDNTATAAVEAIYHELQYSGFASGNLSSASFLGSTLADDAEEYNLNSDRYDFFTNNIRPENSTNYNMWSSAYKQIYNLNALLEGAVGNDNLSEEIKQRIEGEAKFLRAFIYYFLISFYGEVPLVLVTDHNRNKNIEKSQVSDIYTQIEKDLEDASNLLPKDYRYADGQHIRPTVFSNNLLKARVALLQKDFEKAVESSSMIISDGMFKLTELNKVFKANSEESIWQLVPGDPNIGANEGYHHILENNPVAASTTASSALSEDLLTVWEPGDLRYSYWINVYTEGDDDYYYPFKYKIKNGGDSEEYSMVMRLAEVYLIRAEAYAMQGEVNKALADLNIIRNRASLPDLLASDITDIQKSVLEERRRELFSEWGHRWLDLKRFGKMDQILGAKKTQWSPDAKLLPIPEQDILRNPFLTQNPGY